MAVYLGMNPDSLIVESPEFNDPMSGLNFSPINLYYVTQTPNNWDSRRIIYLDPYTPVFLGMDIEINITTGMQNIDVFKEINRNIEEYIVGVAPPNGRNPPGMLIDRRIRGPLYSLSKNDKELVKMSQNIQKTNRFTYYNKIYP